MDIEKLFMVMNVEECNTLFNLILKNKKHKEVRSLTLIDDFIRANDLSDRLKRALIIAKSDFYYIEQISPNHILRVRGTGRKAVHEFIELTKDIRSESKGLTI